MRKILVLWVVSLVATAAATHVLTARFGSISWKSHAGENVDMVIVAGVPVSQATPEMDEAFFRKELFGEDMGLKSYPCGRFGTELGYRGVVLSKKPLNLENPFRAMFQLW